MRRPLLGATVLLLAACASARPTTTATAAGEVVPSTAPVVVRVRSDYAAPLTLYTMSEGVATRLGELAGPRTDEFRLTATQLPTNGITLLAVPRTGAARATTGRLHVVPGSIVELTIGTDLADVRTAVRSP